MWSGALKSFQLDANGFLPVVTAGATTPVTTATPVGTPTPTPAVPGKFIDESDPDNTDPAQRKPVWNAGRVLGYTDPVANLAPGAAAIAASPSGRAPAISVWPGRRMVFARGSAGVPLTRSDFLPNTGSCAGAGTPGQCFDDLMIDMGMTPTSSVTNQARARSSSSSCAAA